MDKVKPFEDATGLTNVFMIFKENVEAATSILSIAPSQVISELGTDAENG